MASLPYHAHPLGHHPGPPSSPPLAHPAAMPPSSPRSKRSGRVLLSALLPYLLFLFASLLLVLSLSSYRLLPTRLSLRQECRMSRMWPSYQLHNPPSPSGQGNKYRLYLYREKPQGRPATIATKRKPALFVPGNAGSYQQVRSLASWSWHEHLLDSANRGKDTAIETDWWTIDFNEDFSAFHSSTLEGQSIYLNEVLEYLHGVYYDSLHKEVPILAHSMGGIVARLALLQSNHPDPSPVKTIITLSTPHYIPPAPIEKGMQQIYQLINHDLAAVRKQRYILFVSLSGGILDTQLPSEYSTLPATWKDQTLQRFTSNLPALWSNVDHLAMMWCDQLRTRIARGIAIEGTAGLKDTLADRRRRWSMTLDLADTASHKLSAWTQGEPTIFLPTNATTNFAIPSGGHHAFTLLAALPVVDNVKVLLCNSTPFEEQACKTLHSWAFESVPASHYAQTWSGFPEASRYYEAPSESLRLLRIDGDELAHEKYSSVAIQHKHPDGVAEWWQAGWSESETHLLGTKISGGLQFELKRVAQAPNAPVRRYRLSSVDSSMFFYDFTFTSECPQDRLTNHFAPMVHVYSLGTGDGRWYPSLDAQPITTLPVSLHATSPFLPPLPTSQRGIVLEIFAPSQGECQPFTSLIVKINWRHSMGLWLSRYRIGVVSWMMAIFALSARKLRREYAQVRSMPQMTQTIFLTMPSARDGGLLLTALVMSLALLQRLLVSLGLAVSWPATVRDLLLGLTGDTAVSFGFASSDLGLSIILSLALAVITWGLVTVVSLMLYIFTGCLASICLVLRLGRVLQFDHDLTLATPNTRRYGPPRMHLSTIIFIILVLASIKVYIPQQFVFLAAVVVQLLNVIRTNLSLRKQTSTLSSSAAQRLQLRHGQNLMVLLHLFLLLPLRGPSLIIFVRNFLAGYARPSTTFATPSRYGGYNFGEDHSVLAILPVLALVQLTSTGRIIEAPQQGAARFATRAVEWMYLLLAGYTLAWGIRYPYVQYDISLLIFSLLLASHYLVRWRIGGSAEQPIPRHARRGSARESESDDVGSGGEESVKLKTRVGADEFGQSSQSRHKEEEEQVESEAAIVPFSIPEELMDETASVPEVPPSSSPSAASHPPRAVSEELHSRASAMDEDVSSARISPPPPPPPPFPLANEVDILVSSYLSQLDEYLLLREKLSETLSKAFFTLSSAQMAAGGWARTAGARRSLWDARLRREVEVGVEVQGTSGMERWALKEVQWTRDDDDDDDGKDGEALDDHKEKKRPSSTTSSGVDGGLRRRKPTGSATSSARRVKRENQQSSFSPPAMDTSVALDEKTMKRKEKEEEKNVNGASAKQEKGNGVPLPPSALYQFSALPSATLRRARVEFRTALHLIVEGEGERTAREGSKSRALREADKEEEGEHQQRNVKENATVGLVQMTVRLRELEESIRLARQRRKTVEEVKRNVAGDQ